MTPKQPSNGEDKQNYFEQVSLDQFSSKANCYVCFIPNNLLLFNYLLQKMKSVK